jgi:diguanylate cyclase (GGDEF)-like protein
VLADLPRLLRSLPWRRGVPLLFWLVGTVAMVGGATLYLYGQDRAAVQRAFTEAEAAAETLEQLVFRVFETVESLHDLMQSRHSLDETGNLAGAEAVAQHLTRIAGNGRFAVQQVSMIGPDGRMAWSSGGSFGIWLGDRAYFHAHAQAGVGGLFLSPPLLSRSTGRIGITATRPLRNADGSFAGVAVVLLDPLALSRLLHEQGPPPGLVFRLRRLPDGTLLAASRDMAEMLTMQPNPAHPAVIAAGMMHQGRLRFVPPALGQEVLAAFRAPREIPLVAFAAIDTVVALADYRHRRTLVIIGLVIASLVGLLAAVMFTLNRGLREKLADEAVRDPLTGLFNRRHLTEVMRPAVNATARDGGLVGLLLLDLDRFKDVNDSLGLPVGDATLCATAARLRATLRDSDTLVRLNADVFAVMTPRMREAADASALAARLLAALVLPLEVQGHAVALGASIGIALAPLDGDSPEQLIRNAEIALYRAKAEARGQHRFFEPAMDAALQERRALEAGLRDALAKQELELHYQPLFDLRQWRVSGFEALLRWRRPGIGLVSPVDFIPLAEETGLITPIGAWVLRQACLDAAQWPAWIKVAVNLSPVQFRAGGAVPVVQAALEASGLRPDRLELEITEGVLLQDSEDTLQQLRALRALGARVALDDFGSGYSSLNYLLRFPFDKVKIDRSFVGDLGSGAGGDGTVIVRAIIGMCRNLNIATTAEGVETEEQLLRLTQEGANEVQGYLFSRPRPAAEVPAMLEEASRKLVRAAA